MPVGSCLHSHRADQDSSDRTLGPHPTHPGTEQLRGEVCAVRMVTFHFADRLLEKLNVVGGDLLNIRATPPANTSGQVTATNRLSGSSGSAAEECVLTVVESQRFQRP